MAVPVQIGGTMTSQSHDDEFERLQTRFRPKVVRKCLERYYELLNPWTYQDEQERGMIYPTQRIHPEPAVFRLADTKASIDWAMHRLTVDDPIAGMVIYGLYVDKQSWEAVSLDTGLPVRQVTHWDVTVGHVEDRAVESMARYLGWRREEVSDE